MLALGDGQIGAFDQRCEHARIVAHEATLLAAQRHVNGRIEVHDGRGKWCDVVRFSDFGDAPVNIGKMLFNTAIRTFICYCFVMFVVILR